MCIRDRPITLTERGDTVTENALLAAALSPGETVLRNASPNYMVQDLCAVSYTHLRAHETVLDLVCRLLLETKNNTHTTHTHTHKKKKKHKKKKTNTIKQDKQYLQVTNKKIQHNKRSIKKQS